jgi:NAD(P)-dependent dehydrogenase (short-subunit alcohol dehydrogenase family)
MNALAGRHALVTGGGTGIGAAIAMTLARAGATVAICGRRSEPLRAVAASDANIRAMTADITDEASVAKLYEQAETAGEPFDIVVANAGMAQSAPAHKTSLDLWNRTLNANLTGAFLTVKPALAAMRGRGFGRIVFIASTAGLKGYAYVAPYVAAKHGVIGLTRALALETAASGITVNAVCPGFTETAMLAVSIDRIVGTTRRNAADVRATLAASNPQGRFIQPQEVADAVLWLCGGASAAITGQAISVSGGETW